MMQHPNQNEEVTVTVTVKDQNGNAVNGANVHLSLRINRQIPFMKVQRTRMV